MATDNDAAGLATATAKDTPPPSDEPPPLVDVALIDANMADSFGEYARAWFKRIRTGDAGILPVIGGLVVIAIIFQTQNSNFLSAENFAGLLTQTSYFVLFGMAEVFVLLLGEIDLSTGYVAACGGAITLILTSQLHNFNWGVAALCGLAFCALVGFIQGLLVTRLGLPSFVVTLGGLLGFEGVLLYILNTYSGKNSGGTVAAVPGVLVDLDNGLVTPAWGWIILAALVAVFAAFTLAQYRRRQASGLVTPPFGLALLKIAGVAVIGVIVVYVCNRNRGRTTTIRGVPWAVFIILGIVLAATFLLSRTRFGRYVYAVGGNAEAARRAGINVNRIRLMCFTLCSFTAGLAGLFYSSYIQSISQSVDGGNLVLYAVAAAVIGGTSLFGGRGKMVYAVLGGFVIATIYNGMGLIGLSSAAQFMVTALVLVAAATIDALARRGRTAS
jgi:D-xylose transport system permease protein